LVRKGIFTEEILKLLYEDYYLNDNETFQRIATRYLGQPFWAFEVEIDSPASEVYALMDSVKGRMSNLSPENATGLRGHLLRERVSRNAKIYGKEGWKDTGNFIHFPDNEIETKRCGKALRLDLKSPFEIWDTYKLFDRDIFLDKRRTVADVEHICQDFPVEKFPTVLDLGCGNGRISRALSEHGYQVFGVDFDGLETEYCEEFDIKGNYEVTNLDKLKITSSKYDLAIFLYGSFVGMTHAQIKSFFINILNNLRKGGALRLDLLDPHFLKQKSTGEFKDLTNKIGNKLPAIKSVKRARLFGSDFIERTQFNIQYTSGGSKTIYGENIVLPTFLLDEMLKAAGFQNIIFYKGDLERITITCYKYD
jgi:SAM-dependent methyltransferase